MHLWYCIFHIIMISDSGLLHAEEDIGRARIKTVRGVRKCIKKNFFLKKQAKDNGTKNSH